MSVHPLENVKQNTLESHTVVFQKIFFLSKFVKYKMPRWNIKIPKEQCSSHSLLLCKMDEYKKQSFIFFAFL